MLDLDYIFDPDRLAPAVAPSAWQRPQPSNEVCPEDLPMDWRIEWEERAAIREYDGGQVRAHAEVEALREIVQRMRAAGEYP